MTKEMKQPVVIYARESNHTGADECLVLRAKRLCGG